MPRLRDPDRLSALIRAATIVFSDLGYRRAQMVDVAQTMGVSPGTLYLYVQGKAALFDLVIRDALGLVDHEAPPEFPISEPPAGATLALVKSRLLEDHLVPELAEPVSRARAVVFVDARADAPAGTVSCEPVRPGAGSAPLTHNLSPQAVLLYAERLFGHVPRAAVVTIGGAAFDHGSALSPEALQAVPRAARKIRSLARLWARQPLPAPADA